MSRTSFRLFAVAGVMAAGLTAGLAPSAWAEAGGCSQPVSSGPDPVASDCLFLLRAAVGSTTCSRPCICQPRGVPTKATDALLCLQFSVGQAVAIDCPCNGVGQPDLESSATTFDPQVDITPDVGVTGHDYNSSTVSVANPWGIDDAAIRSRYVKTRYLGAFSQDAAPAKGNWTADWSVEVNGNHTSWHPATVGTLNGATPSADATCPSGTTLIGNTTLPSPFAGSMDICQLPGRFATSEGTLALTNDNVYRLAGLGTGGTLIGDGDAAGKTETQPVNPPFTKAAHSILTIEAGTLVLGDIQEALIITRGSQIFANGTAANPISMNSVTQFNAWKAGTDYTGLGVGTGARREWGGLVLEGFGWVNFCNNPNTCDAITEGVAVTVYYGGKNANWNVGSVSYIEISNSGYDINGAGNDLNGLTLYGLGHSSTVSHIDVNHAGDDSFELFGGTVVLDHVIATGGLDDNLDSDVGFRGGAQFALLRQFPDDGDKGIEPDNGPNTVAGAADLEPRSHPHYANVTWLGQKTAGAQAGTSMSLRTSTGMLLANSLLGGSKRTELRSEAKDAGTPGTGGCQYAGPSGLNVQRIKNTWINANPLSVKSVTPTATANGNFEGVNVTDFGCVTSLFTSGAGNQTMNPMLDPLSGYPNQLP